MSNRTALYIAIEKRNIEIVKLLLEKKDFDCNIKIIFNYLKRRNQYFVDEKNEITVLHYAIESENIQIVKMLLSNPNIDVNACSLYFYEREYNNGMRNRYNYFLKTALHRAIEKSNTAIVQLLLNHSKIKVNRFTDYLHYEKNFGEEFAV